MTQEQFEKGSIIREELLNLEELKNLLNRQCSTFHLNFTNCEDLINSLQEVVKAYQIKLKKEFEEL